MENYDELNHGNLIDLYAEYGPFHTSIYIKNKWRLYPKDYSDNFKGTINHREVLPSEVVFDLDTECQKRQKLYLNKLITKLDRGKYTYDSYHTGGKGSHTHTFWEGLAQLSTEDRSLMKECILNAFFNKRERVYAGVDYQLCTRHLVRAEYGLHEKTLNRKLPISSNGDRHKFNKIPAKAKIEYMKRKMDKKERAKIVRSGTGISRAAFPCVTTLLSQDFAKNKDGRKRALNILSCYFYKNVGDKGINTIKEWNDYKLNGYFKEHQVERSFKNMKAMVDSGKSYGCRATGNLLGEFGLKDEVCSICILNSR